MRLIIISILLTTTCHAQIDATVQFKIDSLGKVIAYNNMLLNKRIDSLNTAKDTLVGIIGEIKMTQITASKGTIGIDPVYTQRLEAIERKLATFKAVTQTIITQ